MKFDRLQNYLSEALLEAHKSKCNFQHGCVIVYKDRIVSRGHNNESLHSEAMALKSLEKVYCGL